MKVAASIAIWVFVAMLTVFVFLATLSVIILFPFDQKRQIAHAQGYWWADALIKFNPFLKLSLRGLENIDPRQTYVIVANHQSMADIALLYKTHRQFKWVAKDSLFKIPVFGWCMSLMKYIRLSRGKYSSIKDAYQEAGEWLEKGVSVLFFSEGTRSTSERINPFKSGAFRLAIQGKRSILPIRIQGARNVISRGSWIFGVSKECRLTVLPVIETQGFGPDDFERLRGIVHEKLDSLIS